MAGSVVTALMGCDLISTKIFLKKKLVLIEEYIEDLYKVR